jgi:formylglycine-generating enzyme required for sulfatase activity
MDSHVSPEHFPHRLAELGFQGQVTRDVEVIVPPICIVPAGPFLMGSDPRRRKLADPNELPLHTVTLPSYAIACFPVTVAEYACFVRAGHPEPPRLYRVDWPTQLSALDHPVVNVTWYDARDYAAWLTERAGDHFRLPTEAEWEKAARGTDGRLYPWGNRFYHRCGNTYGSRHFTTTPVWIYADGASPYGVYDLVGNVWEWTRSRYLPYPYTTAGEREDLGSSEARVHRGGSWSASPPHASAVTRSFHRPDVFDHNLGFRLVRATSSS